MQVHLETNMEIKFVIKPFLSRVVKKIASVRQRTWLKIFVLACVVWFFWYPKRMDSLYMAIPSGATVATYHDGLASQWKGLVNNETLLAVMGGFGLEGAEKLKKKSGIYHTMYWLSGRHTVAGFVPQRDAGVVPQTSQNLVPDGYLAAASYVGWKAKIMELLWRIKWVPGLGKLEVTPNGTRYLLVEVPYEYGSFMMLGLDMVDGVLIATFSRNPEDVCLLADRLKLFGPNDFPAMAFDGEKPWKTKLKAKHRIWFSDHPLLQGSDPFNVEVSSLCELTFKIVIRGRFESDAFKKLKSFADLKAFPLPGSDVPAAAAPVLLAVDASIIPKNNAPYTPPAGEGLLLGYLSAKPYHGRFIGLAYPALNVVMPGVDNDAFGEWAYEFTNGMKREFKEAGIKTSYKTEGPVRTLFVSLSILEMLGKVSTKDQAFAELREGFLRLGSHYGSSVKQRAAQREGKAQSLAAIVSEWQRVHPDAVAAVRVDLPVAAEEFSHLSAIAKMASSLVPNSNSAQTIEGIGTASWALQALSPLGIVECIAIGGEPGLSELRISTKYAEPN